ncbi:hypothetical protein BC830DRAFT_1169908 [Chytriomyces sp. MP71]|nr:hypothetical protein BC830DRAFT_1169908 [Chytriomyces sp. MP71]
MIGSSISTIAVHGTSISTSTDCMHEPSLPSLPPASPSAAMGGPRSPSSAFTPSITALPNELLLIACAQMPTAALLSLRLTCKRLSALAALVLRDRTRAAVSRLQLDHERMEAEHARLEDEKRPHLRHYKQFLRNIAMNDLTEAIWYAAPPEELKTVCECLTILRGTTTASSSSPASSSHATPKRASFSHHQPTDLSATSSTSDDTLLDAGMRSLALGVAPAAEPHTTTSSSWTAPSHLLSHPTAQAPLQLYTDDPAVGVPQTWAGIKKHMTRYDFKSWLQNLRVNVDRIPYAAVKRVEYIIMHDQSITYERLREVSRPGYSLLIVVAACLQYGNISEEVKGKGREMEGVEACLQRGRLFLGCIER